MKKIVLAMTAASALCVGVPAHAQLGDVVSSIFGGGGYDSRLRQLEQRIQNGIQRGTISRGEGDQLWSLLQDLRARESQYDDNGYTEDERHDLDRRISELDRRISEAEHGGNGGGYNGGNDGQFEDQLRDLRDRIEQGVRSGRLTGSEAQYLRAQLYEINRREQQYDNDGLSRAERDDLRNRIERLRRELENAIRDGDNLNGRDCPPGLAKKNNGCLPPGQAKKGGDYDRDDRYYDERRDRDDD